MKIISLNEVDSTHKYLKEYIKENGFSEEICIVTQNQSAGIGSRGNSWTGKKNNLFFSFVLSKSFLASDLPIQSSSIYFSFLLCEVLNSFGSKVWLKWPNDFYIDNKKIGGTITTMSGELLYCGIGINLNHVSDEYGYLDIDVDIQNLLSLYFESLEKRVSWKQVFSLYEIEFQRSKSLKSTIENQKISLANAILNSDGSISINEKKVYSLR